MITIAEDASRFSMAAGYAKESDCRDKRDSIVSVPPPARRSAFPQGIRKHVFLAFKDLIYKTAGINLTDKKISLLEGRLSRRLRALEIASYEDYLDYLNGGKNQEEMVQMLNCVSTNETTFFREPAQYTFLEQRVFPKIRADAQAGLRKKTVKVWSAACSSGDELYSAAMCLLHHFPLEEGWSIDAVGTDISTRVLNIALQGIWPVERAKSVPPKYLKRFMLRGGGEQQGKMAAGREIRDIVRFKRANLYTDAFSDHRNFDVIFCRNVLIYFNAESKARVINKLVNCLRVGGYFLVGHAETLHGLDQRLQRHIPTVYSRDC
jgi:chemotaxis protein methyltransferase CheR